ncbi:MAG: hypothetical protein M0Z50_13230 [Planctomycetia bacterium]|nr:hypothetical protein [Planctomycetia bacterium]
MTGSVSIDRAISRRHERKTMRGDVWIAVNGLEHQLPLGTANEKAFMQINGLRMDHPRRQEEQGKQNG